MFRTAAQLILQIEFAANGHLKMDERIIQYVKRNLDAGYSAEAVMRALIKAGYDRNTAYQYIYNTFSSYRDEDKGYPSHAMNTNKKQKSFAKIIFAVLIIAIISYGAYIYLPKFAYQILDNKLNDTEIGAGKIDNNEDLSLLNSALIEHDSGICEHILDNTIKEQCRSSFALNANETCDNNCQDQKLLNRALIERNSDLCQKIKNKGTKENCMHNFNTAKNNNASCDNSCKDMNLLNLALIEKDDSFCLQINDSSIKIQCQQIFKKEVNKNEESQT